MFAFSWVGSALASCAATCACHACTFASKEVMRRSARLAYCVLFTLAMALAWVLRDFAKPLIDKLPCAPALFVGCGVQGLKCMPTSPVAALVAGQLRSTAFPSDKGMAGQEQVWHTFPPVPGIVHAGGVDPSERWYGQQAVYRISLGNFVRPALAYRG